MYLSICLSVRPSVHPSCHPSMHPSIHPSIHPSAGAETRCWCPEKDELQDSLPCSPSLWTGLFHGAASFHPSRPLAATAQSHQQAQLSHHRTAIVLRNGKARTDRSSWGDSSLIAGEPQMHVSQNHLLDHGHLIDLKHRHATQFGRHGLHLVVGQRLQRSGTTTGFQAKQWYNGAGAAAHIAGGHACVSCADNPTLQTMFLQLLICCLYCCGFPRPCCTKYWVAAAIRDPATATDHLFLRATADCCCMPLPCLRRHRTMREWSTNGCCVGSIRGLAAADTANAGSWRCHQGKSIFVRQTTLRRPQRSDTCVR